MGRVRKRAPHLTPAEYFLRLPVRVRVAAPILNKRTDVSIFFGLGEEGNVCGRSRYEEPAHNSEDGCEQALLIMQQTNV